MKCALPTDLVWLVLLKCKGAPGSNWLRNAIGWFLADIRCPIHSHHMRRLALLSKLQLLSASRYPMSDIFSCTDVRYPIDSYLSAYPIYRTTDMHSLKLTASFRFRVLPLSAATWFQQNTKHHWWESNGRNLQRYKLWKYHKCNLWVMKTHYIPKVVNSLSLWYSLLTINIELLWNISLKGFSGSIKWCRIAHQYRYPIWSYWHHSTLSFSAI